MNTLSIRAFIPPLTRRCPSVSLPLRLSRTYAVQSPGAPTLEIFSHQQKWMQKERAAADVETSRNVDYLRDEVANRLCERLMVIRLALFFPPSLPSRNLPYSQAFPQQSCLSPEMRNEC